ncbi:MAG: hypothetical protein ACM34H_09440 [Deltaproteobacteria bacterium]
MAKKQRYEKRGWLSLVFCLLLLIPGLSAGNARGEEDFKVAVQAARTNGVSEELINRILIAGYHYSLESGDLAGFLVVVSDAEKRKLPVEPLVGKMEEGLAKRVEAPRIQQALRRDLVQYGLVMETLQNTLFDKGYPRENAKSGAVVRLARALSMGIAQSEMQSLLQDAPKVSIGEIVDAVEFTAALKQAGEAFPEAKEITLVGLQSGFFTRTAWTLPLMVSAAKMNHLPDDKIKASALEVVKGNKTVLEAHTGLGLDPKSLSRGPLLSGPSSPGVDRGDHSGKGQTGAPGTGGQGSGGPGGGGSGAGGGSGGSGGAAGPGGGAGGGAGGPGGGGAGGPGR